jgi:protoporphyrinogen/coproporphyrinogen III oxidase
MAKPRSCVVVGAGFSGLSLAYWATKHGANVTVFEAQNRVGGLLSSKRLPGGHLVESAANGFIWSEDFAELERDLGLRFISTRPESRKRYIFRRLQFRRWPLSILESLSLLWHLCRGWRRRNPLAGETISAWGERMLGSAGRVLLLETALQGIYAGDPSRMSATLILGRFFRKRKSDTRESVEPVARDKRSGTHSHADGMGALTRDLRSFLEKSGRCEFRMETKFSSDDLSEARSTNSLVFLAVPAQAASEILSQGYPSLAQELSTVEMRSVVTSTSIWPLSVGERGMPLGFGALFPRGEGVEALGVLRNHHIYNGRSDRVSETWIYGADSLRPRGIWGKPEALSKLIIDERRRIGAEGLAPEAFECYFWERGIPHYTVALEELLERIDLEGFGRREGVVVFGNFTGHLGLSRMFAEARRLARERLSDG